MTNTTPVSLSTSPGAVLTGPSLPGSGGGTSYVVSATVDVLAPQSDISPVSVTCNLGLGLQTDQATYQVPAGLITAQEGTLYLALGATITSAQTPTLTCKLNGSSDAASSQRAELTATEVGTLH